MKRFARNEWSIILFILGIIILNYPFILIFNRLVVVFGFPLFFIYLAIGWIVSIGVIWLYVRGTGKEP